MGVSELFGLINAAEINIDLGEGKGERAQKTCLGKVLSSLRDRQFGGYKVVHAGKKNGAQLWKLLITSLISEHVVCSWHDRT